MNATDDEPCAKANVPVIIDKSSIQVLKSLNNTDTGFVTQVTAFTLPKRTGKPHSVSSAGVLPLIQWDLSGYFFVTSLNPIGPVRGCRGSRKLYRYPRYLLIKIILKITAMGHVKVFGKVCYYICLQRN